MKIGVAVLAFVWRIGEFQIFMAVAARDFGVTATKRKAGLHMVELDLAWNYLPVRRCMAGIARELEITVRTLRGSKGPRRLSARGTQREEERHQTKEQSRVKRHRNIPVSERDPRSKSPTGHTLRKALFCHTEQGITDRRESPATMTNGQVNLPNELCERVLGPDVQIRCHMANVTERNRSAQDLDQQAQPEN